MGMFAGTPFDRPPHCERCERLESECVCPPEVPATISPASQKLKVSLEKRKRGKSVSVVQGFADDPPAVQNVLTKLKTVCGAGGTLKEGVIEIQGDHQPRIRSVLSEMGYVVR